MSIETIAWRNGKIKYIDQTLLPHRLKYVYCGDIERFWRAIRNLEVRGAPALGIAGALGIILGIKDSKAKTFKQFSRELKDVIEFLGSSRPTAVNLFWAFERMERLANENKDEPISGIKEKLLREALDILEEDKRSCRLMAKYGADLIKTGDRILTHCNAGGLATADYGTALGVLFEAHKQGKRIHVYADETRPLLQGARLTAWELMREGIDTTLICDNMAASLMEREMIDKIFVGADRIASNGDAANKIGTYSLAVLAAYHKVRFYVVAPTSTFDFRIKSGSEIPIEERSPDEVRRLCGRLMAPNDVKVYNPAFDVTPNHLIRAIVTEKGIFKKPYMKNLKRLAR